MIILDEGYRWDGSVGRTVRSKTADVLSNEALYAETKHQEKLELTAHACATEEEEERRLIRLCS